MCDSSCYNLQMDTPAMQIDIYDNQSTHSSQQSVIPGIPHEQIISPTISCSSSNISSIRGSASISRGYMGNMSHSNESGALQHDLLDVQFDELAVRVREQRKRQSQHRNSLLFNDTVDSSSNVLDAFEE